MQGGLENADRNCASGREVIPPDPLAQRRIGDRAEDGDTERAAHRSGEHVGAGDDAAALPSTADCAEISVGLATRPRPNPITKQVAATCQTELPETAKPTARTDQEHDGTDQRGPPEADSQVDATGDRGGKRPAQRERREREACDQRAGMEHALGVQRDEEVTPISITPSPKASEIGRVEQPAAKDPARKDWLSGSSLHQCEADQEHRAELRMVMLRPSPRPKGCLPREAPG